MAEAKLDVCVGRAKFSGEGSEDWLSKEFGTFLSFSKSNSLLDESSDESDEQEHEPQEHSPDTSSLPKFLADKLATTNQIRKFLATAAWLQKKNVGRELSTADVAKALRESHQTKINNPSQELGRNIAKGYCERSGSGFFVTQDGLDTLR
jgi:hypothetical protein